MGIASLIGIIVYLFPFIAALLVMVWLYRIKQNSDEQVAQNQEIITLLKEINTRE